MIEHGGMRLCCLRTRAGANARPAPAWTAYFFSAFFAALWRHRTRPWSARGSPCPLQAFWPLQALFAVLQADWPLHALTPSHFTLPSSAAPQSSKRTPTRTSRRRQRRGRALGSLTGAHRESLLTGMGGKRRSEMDCMVTVQLAAETVAATDNSRNRGECCMRPGNPCFSVRGLHRIRCTSLRTRLATLSRRTLTGTRGAPYSGAFACTV